MFCEVFNWMPVAALIDEKILCMHGGLSKELILVEQIKDIKRPTEVPENGKYSSLIISGLLCDLLWSDPSEDIKKDWVSNERGVSYLFSKNVVDRFLTKNNLDLIVRAHQVVESGYEFFSGQQLLTLFSAPNYCEEFDNYGAILNVDENLICSFQLIEPHESAKSNKKDKKKMKSAN